MRRCRDATRPRICAADARRLHPAEHRVPDPELGARAATLAITIDGAGFDPTSSVPEVYRPDGVLLATRLGDAALSRTHRGHRRAGRREPGRLHGEGAQSRRHPVERGGAPNLVGEVNVSPASGQPGTPFTYSGRGFTGRSGVTSHLQGPDGLEWQAKRIGTSPEGTFEQTIVSGEFVPGTYAVWAMDDRTKITSPRFTFQVAVRRRRRRPP